MRVTECGKEAWSVNREPMNKNRIEGAVEQGEWAIYHEALVTNARWRKCGGCAMKVCVLTLHGHPKESKIDGVKFRRVCCLTSGFFMQVVTPANHDGIRGRGSNLGTVLKVQGKRRNVLATV
jgi:hypothetical protein